MDLHATAQLLGNFGEFVGVIAVVLTLAYLAAQIRQNTGAVRASALDSAITSVSNIRQAPLADGEITALWRGGLTSPDDLNDIELERFRLLMHNIVTAIWNVYARSEYVGLSEKIWQTQRITLSRVMNTDGGIWFWSHYRSEFEESFQSEVERVIKLG